MQVQKQQCDDLKKVLKRFGAVGKKWHPDEGPKLYEAYVLVKIAERCRDRRGWFWTIHDTTGKQTSRLPIRGGPGYLAGAGYIRVQGQRRSVELHQGVKWAGRSDVAHEADVAIVYSLLPSQHRANHAIRMRILNSIECKLRAARATISEARERLGYQSDVEADKMSFLTYRGPNAAVDRVFEYWDGVNGTMKYWPFVTHEGDGNFNECLNWIVDAIPDLDR